MADAVTVLSRADVPVGVKWQAAQRARRAAGRDHPERALGEGPLVDLARDLEPQKLAAMEVGEAFAYLRPRLKDLEQLRQTG